RRDRPQRGRHRADRGGATRGRRRALRRGRDDLAEPLAADLRRPSLAEARERLGEGRQLFAECLVEPLPAAGSVDVLMYGRTGHVLHRAPLSLCASAQGVGFIVGKSQDHRHMAMVSRAELIRRVMHDYSTFDKKARVRSCRGLAKTSRGGPDSTITPSSMNTRVSPASRAKPISCVTTTIVMP